MKKPRLKDKELKLPTLGEKEKQGGLLPFVNL